MKGEGIVNRLEWWMFGIKILNELILPFFDNNLPSFTYPFYLVYGF